MITQTPSIRVTAVIECDPKWLDNQARDDLRYYLREKLDAALGYRGDIKQLSVQYLNATAR